MLKLEGGIKFDNKFLKDLRVTHGFTMDETAKRLSEYVDKKDYSRQAVQYWESGRTMPSVNTLIGLAKLYGVKMGSFFIDERYDPESVPEMISIAQVQLRNAQIKLRKERNGV